MTNELNPYSATVIAYIGADNNLADERLSDQRRLLINAGEDDGLSVGDRVLVFAMGPEVFDPTSKESLGRFELVRGEAKVTSTQMRMAIITSTATRTVYDPRPVNALLAAAGGKAEYNERTVSAGFVNPELGDLVRFI